MEKKYLEYQEQNTLLEGYVAYKTSPEKKPLVLIAHAWQGRNQLIQDIAEKIAELGYVGFAWDLYGKGKIGTTTEENAKLMQPLVDDRALLLRRMMAGLNTAKALPMVHQEKIAAIGYCFGGLCVLDLARSGAALQGVVSFHGLLNAPKLPPKKITAKILALHGYNDPMVPPEEVMKFQKEMDDAQVDWQFHTYGNTKHAFTNPQANDADLGLIYKKSAAERSWLEMQEFLSEIF